MTHWPQETFNSVGLLCYDYTRTLGKAKPGLACTHLNLCNQSIDQ